MCDQSGGSHKNDKEMTYDIVRKAHPAFSGLRGYIEKCCAKLDSNTSLLVALPCRLDKSSDNFEGSRYIVSVPRLHCKVQEKIKTEHCFFLLLTMQNGLIQ